MATFLMFGKYSAQAMKEMSPGRTQKAVDLIKKLGGEVKGMYALLGQIRPGFHRDPAGNRGGHEGFPGPEQDDGHRLCHLPGSDRGGV